MNKVQPVVGGDENGAEGAVPAAEEAPVQKNASLSLAPANLLEGGGDTAEPVKSPMGKKFDPDWGRHAEIEKRSAITTYALQDHLTQQFPMYALCKFSTSSEASSSFAQTCLLPPAPPAPQPKKAMMNR